ncbi:hypothetical protein ACSVH2_10510 [Flavobacterium sp. RSB2_4_14]|uniref:hypothetical protein n=1 Tax=Flavobacterium sp. RSB2_4_14 TaxID=3447665 RepID=UPI003F3EDC68
MYLKNYSQSSDFIVTKSYDTIYVDKIELTDYNVKTKKANQKKKYNIEEIISYYIANKKKYYERITNQIEKKELKDSDRYDYKRMENLYIEEYDNRIKYKFIQRLTIGKVKLFCEDLKQTYTGSGTPGTPNYTPASHNDDKNYYISIYDSKLEPINKESDINLFDFSQGLTLNKEVYEILKLYLYGNKDIDIKLDTLFSSKPIAKEKQIIDLINEYNLWVKSNK